jgi:hypothetical protein
METDESFVITCFICSKLTSSTNAFATTLYGDNGKQRVTICKPCADRRYEKWVEILQVPEQGVGTYEERGEDAAIIEGPLDERKTKLKEKFRWAKGMGKRARTITSYSIFHSIKASAHC